MATAAKLILATGALSLGPLLAVWAQQLRPARRDSAGIEIVESGSPTWSPGTGWVVDPEPVLQIGRVSGPDEYLFTGIVGIVVFDGGPIVVANRGFRYAATPTGNIIATRQVGDNTLRYFDLDGRFLARAGGGGSGPEEFERLTMVGRVRDEIWGFQSPQLPVKVFSRRGAFVRSIRPAWPPGTVNRIVGALDNGGLVVGDGTRRGRPSAGETRLDSVRVMIVRPGGGPDMLAAVPRVLQVGQKTGLPAVQAFGPYQTMTVGRGGLYMSWSADPQITVFDESGRRARIIRWNASRIAVTDSDKRAYRASLVRSGMDTANRFVRQSSQAVFESMVFPSHHPVHEVIVIDDVGNAWVRRPQRIGPAASAAWDVFDTTGVWLGPVSVPADLRVMAIGTNHLTGIWMDDNDVEYVRMYRLRKGGR